MRRIKGVVFNLLEQAVVDKYGDDAWESLLEAAELDGAYTAVGSYPDADLMAIVGKASIALEVPVDDLVRWFGRASIPLLYARYAAFFDPYQSTRSFVLTLNDVIHPEVRKLFPGADAPSFDFDDSDPDSLTLAYHSSRGLCMFAVGLIEGAALHFDDEVTVEQPECTRRGDDQCVLVCRFGAVA